MPTDSKKLAVNLPTPTNTSGVRYKPLEKLGEGTYGVVNKAVDSFETRFQRLVALKHISKIETAEGILGTTLREVMILKKVHHPYIVDMFDVLIQPPSMTLVFDFCEYDLTNYMKAGLLGSARAPKPVPAGDIAQAVTIPPTNAEAAADCKRILYQLLQGVEYLHRLNIAHRDLKPRNILLQIPRIWTLKAAPVKDESSASSSLHPQPPTTPSPSPSQRTARSPSVSKSDTPWPPVVKIADFGLARVEGVPVKKYTHDAITLWFRPPDVILGSVMYGLTADMWSLGCIFAEMACGKTLFNGDTLIAQLRLIFGTLGRPDRDNFPSMDRMPNVKTFNEESLLWAQLPPADVAWDRFIKARELNRILDKDGLDLLRKMLQYEPSRRITAAQALEHPYLREFSCNGSKAH